MFRRSGKRVKQEKKYSLIRCVASAVVCFWANSKLILGTMKEDFFTIWNPVTFLPSPMCIWRHRAGCLAWSCLRWHHVCQIWFIRPWDHANSRNRNIYHWFSVEHSLLTTSMCRNLIIGCRIICKGMDQLPATVRRFFFLSNLTVFQNPQF